MPPKGPNKPRRRYKSVSEDVIREAIGKIKRKELSITKASSQFNIPKGTLMNRLKNLHCKNVGSPTVFSPTEEKSLVEALLIVSEWGFPFTGANVRNLAKNYLDSMGRNITSFGDFNLPGKKWLQGFLKRNKATLTLRTCQNLKTSKAKLSTDDVKNYFENLKTTLLDKNNEFISANRIFDYDETV